MKHNLLVFIFALLSFQTINSLKANLINANPSNYTNYLNTLFGINNLGKLNSLLLKGNKLQYNDILPIKHQNENLSSLFIPFTLLDKYLYRNNLLPITHYVNSVILVTSYFIFIIILILFIFFSTINKIYKK